MSSVRGIGSLLLTGMGSVALLAPAAPARASLPVASSPASAEEAPTAADLELPRPDLSGLAPVAREKIETLQRAVDEMAAGRREGAAPPVPLGQAVGFLGQMYHALDLLAAAEACYGQAARLAPEEPSWPYLRGLTRHASGELAGAVEDYRAAVELAPGESAPGLRLGEVLLELDRRDDARQAFEAVLASHPDSAAARFGLGRATEDAAEVVEHLEEALRLEPEATAVHYPLAQAYRRLGREEEARRHLARRGDREPAFPDQRGAVVAQIEKSIALEVLVELAGQSEGFSEESFLGFATSALGPTPAVVAALGRALEGIPEAETARRARLRAALGVLQARLGHDEEAVGELDRALETDPGLRVTARELGDALVRLERWSEAAEAYSKALADGPAEPELLSRRAMARMRAGRPTEARADLEGLIELEPDKAQHRLRLAAVLAQLGDAAAARGILEDAIAASVAPGDRAAAQVALGDLHRAAGENEAAVAAYAAAVASDPAAAPAHLALAGLQARRGRYLEAAGAYEDFLEIDPEHTGARVGLVTALIFLGEHAEAARVLEEGLLLEPDELDFKDILARHLAACPDRSVRDGARALELALELYRSVPSTESAETLAMAYAEAGQLEEAVRWQRELLEQLGDEVEPETAERWRKHLELYQRGEACCGEP